MPADGKLTINGIGSLEVSGGDSFYESVESAIDGKAGTAIAGSIAIQGDVRVTVTGGSCKSGYHEEDVQAGNGIDGDVEINAGQLNVTGGSALNSYHDCTAGHGVTGNAAVNAGQLIAAGGLAAEADYNKGGDGVHGSAEVNGGQLTATGGQAFEGSNTDKISVRGGNGVFGNAKVNDGQLTATGGQASGGKYNTNSYSRVQAGHGVNGNAVINGGKLIATGNSASSPKNLSYIIGGNGINGAVTAAGGYVLATGGEGNSSQMGKAAAATDASPVIIGSSEKRLSASVGAATSPDTPLNNSEFYTKATNETSNVSGMRSLETKEHFAVTYVCVWDGCGQSVTDYADSVETYNVKSPESFGFGSHSLPLAGFVDINGDMVNSLTVSEPITLYAVWKAGFSFEAGEGGTGEMPQRDVFTFDGWVTLPECGFYPPEGYRFAGWKINGDDDIYAVGDKILADGTITLTAAWERAVTYVCVWDGCGQSVTDYANDSEIYQVKSPESIGLENHGLSFVGFVDINGNMVNSLTVSEPITLYAAWKAGVSFEAGEGGTGEMTPIDEITFNGRIALPECGFYPPEGYRFAGWRINGDDEIYAVGDKILADGMITLTAAWERIPGIPDTGDSGRPMLWLILCLGACVSLLWLRRSVRN